MPKQPEKQANAKFTQKQFEGKTLEEAYEKASSVLECSIIDLNIEIVQSPTKGFLGLFSKTAIITASTKYKKYQHNKDREFKRNRKRDLKVETLSTRLNGIEETHSGDILNTTSQVKDERIFNDFYDSKDQTIHNKVIVKKDKEELVNEIKTQVNELFSKLCYKIDEIEVDVLEDGNTVYIEFSGEDSALLIGKEGYRYKALSYILFNWINEKYNMMLRLEVAQFLNNQEQSIYTYLEPVIQIIKDEGFYKTKPLDGILVHIALTKLRDEFPDKYVAVKTNQRGEKYILVNEYRN